uniref:(northern house mosquito) hypothetical protein n=1 Tax=Culex pipiens TaxID=7175 RepID=A0A8D8P2U5_CULPI
MTSRMDNLDLLTDDELRLRLMQYGFQNLPITSNTRKLLIKKLRNHMESEKGKLRRETSYATRYSSGEESDGGAERRGSGRRATTSATVNSRMTMPPPPARPVVNSSSSKRTSAISSSSSINNNNVNSYSTNNNNHKVDGIRTT